MAIICMIDCETLATGPDAVLLQAAAVVYDTEKRRELLSVSKAFDLSNQIAAGYAITASTLAWWMMNNDAVKKDLFSLTSTKTEPEKDTLHEFFKLIHPWWYAIDSYWAYGATFDFPLLQYHLDKIGANNSNHLPYRKLRCLRTLFGLFDYDLAKNQPVATHDALDDCRRQIAGLQDVIDAHSGIVL